MQQYLEMLRHILENGERRENRTGVDTIGVFGYQMRFDLQKGFPLLTTKKVAFGAMAHELIWFLSGDTNVKYLRDNNVRIWEDWTREDGTIGPGYPKQWRRWAGDYAEKASSVVIEGRDEEKLFGHVRVKREEIDQISNVIDQIKTNPQSRRLIVSAWNVADIDKMALPPCHALFQFFVSNDKKLSCHLYQRSADSFLGVPFNIASYALLTHMIAHVCDLEVGEFIHSFGDLHIYVNHIDQVREQLSREPRSLPQIKINPDKKDIFQIARDDITLVGYDPHPAIKGEVAV